MKMPVPIVKIKREKGYLYFLNEEEDISRLVEGKAVLFFSH